MKNLVGTIIFVVVLIGLVFGISVWSGRVEPKPELIPFAQCLAKEEVTMYGAEWCPHCKNEKARFGSAWEYVPYVECPENQQLCLEKGVKGYPTWIKKDGSKYEGEQGLERLSQISGCALPEES